MIIKKYVRVDNGFLLFPDTYEHAVIAEGMAPISAGFVVSHNGNFVYSGESSSLGLPSLPEDTELLKEWLSC